jgi:amidohydrolase
MEIKARMAELKEELVTLRRDFHKQPELGFQEFRTQKVVKKYLQTLGIQTRKMAKTGVIGLLKGGKPGKTILLRADMDAIPVQEENDLPYRSVNDGVMHACGHDGHMAMLLVAAKVLSEYRKDIA